MDYQLLTLHLGAFRILGINFVPRMAAGSLLEDPVKIRLAILIEFKNYNI